MFKRFVAIVLTLTTILALAGCASESPYINEDDLIFAINGKAYKLGVTFGELLKNTDVDKGLVDLKTRIGGGDQKKVDVTIKTGNKRSTISLVLTNNYKSDDTFESAKIEQIYVEEGNLKDHNALTLMGIKLSDGVDKWDEVIGKHVSSKTDKVKNTESYSWEKTIRETKNGFYATLEMDHGTVSFMMISKIGAKKIK